MTVENLRFYGKPFTDAEGSWPADVKKRMKRKSLAVTFKRLGFLNSLRFLTAMPSAMKGVKKIDLEPFRARGLTNQAFIKTQLEYLAFFIALKRIVGSEQAVSIAKDVMIQASKEPMLLCLPEHKDVRKIGQPFDVFRKYWRAMPEAGAQGGSHLMEVSEDSPQAFQFNVKWCVWLELARAAGVPEACIPNCYADDLVFPDYFGDLNIQYRRTQTLANGGQCCDFRFECRKKSCDQ